MMTQQIGFSVLSAPLAAIDRRALSQAWYSALHCARAQGRAARPVPDPLRASVEAEGGAVRAGEVDDRSRSHAVATERRAAERCGESRDRCAPNVPERRLARSALSQKIERTLLLPAKRAERATFTVDGTNARVHVTLQGAEGELRLVAVCPPALYARVARALEEARYALAARGLRCVLDVKEA